MELALPRELEPLRHVIVSHERSRVQAQTRPDHQRQYKAVPGFLPGFPGASTFEEGGAEILVCMDHHQEYCGHCTCDYRDMNEDARRAAAAEYASVDAADLDCAPFVPKRM